MALFGFGGFLDLVVVICLLDGGPVGYSLVMVCVCVFDWWVWWFDGCDAADFADFVGVGLVVVWVLVW